MNCGNHETKFNRGALIFALMVIGAVGVCRADSITYSIDLAGSESGGVSVTGYVVTDGTIGTLSASDFINWDLVLTNTFGTAELDSGNSSVFVFGSDVTASPTVLQFDYSGSDGGAFVFNGYGTYLQFVTGSRASLSEGYVTMLTDALHGTATSEPGTKVIGTVVPEPSSLLLLGTGLLGLGRIVKRKIVS